MALSDQYANMGLLNPEIKLDSPFIPDASPNDVSEMNQISNMNSLNSFTNSLSPYWQKHNEITMTLDEKLNAVRQNSIAKLVDTSGYRKGYITFMPDADSGTAIDNETGEELAFRFGSFNPLDATDKMSKVMNNGRKAYQPAIVSQLTGKSVEELTEDDYENVKNYQAQEMIKSLTEQDYKFSQYNPYKIYDKPVVDKIPFYYKVTGVDETYGRNIIDAVSPISGRSISTDAALNPYLNTQFKLYQSINTSENEARYNEWQSKPALDFIAKADSHGINVDDIINRYNADTGIFTKVLDRLAYTAKRGLASSYETFGRYLRTILPEGTYDKEYWENLDKQQGNGLTAADIAFGVNPTQALINMRSKELANEKMNAAADAWNKGNYLEASWGTIQYLVESGQSLDRLFADSFGQMGASTTAQGIGGLAGGAVGGRFGGSAGAKAGATVGAIAFGAVATAIDETVQVWDQYRENNNGKTMSPAQILRTFGEHVVAAVPEQFLQMAGLKKVLPSKMSQAIFEESSQATFRLASKEGLKIVGKESLKGAAGETGQEWLQNTISAYESQNQKNAESLLDVATGREQIFGGLSGGLMGGALSGLSTVGGAIRNRKVREKVEQVQSQAQNYTVDGRQADSKVSSSVLSKGEDIINTINNNSSVDDKLVAANHLQNLLQKNPDVNRETYDKLMQQRAAWDSEAITSYINQGLSKEQIEEKINSSVEKTLATNVWYSNINPMKAFRENKLISQEAIDENKARIRELGRKLNLDENYVEQLIDEVSTGIKTDNSSHVDTIASIKDTVDKLKNKKLTSEEKTNLTNSFNSDINDLSNQFLAKLEILQAITDAVPELTRPGAKSKSTASAREGKWQYTVLADELANETLEKGGGTYRIVRNLIRDMKDIADVLSEHSSGTDLAKGVTQLLTSRGIDLDAAEKIEAQFRNLANNVRIKVRDDQAKADEDLAKDRNKYISTLASRAEWLAKNPSVGSENTTRGRFIQSINNALNNDPTIADAIKEIVNNKTKVSEQFKKNVSDTIDKIADLNTTIANDTNLSKQERERVVKNVDTFISKYTDEEIQKSATNLDSDSTDELDDKYNRLHTIFKTITAIRDSFNTISDTSNEDTQRRKNLDKKRELVYRLISQAKQHIATTGNRMALSSVKNIDNNKLTSETKKYLAKIAKSKRESYLNNELLKIQNEADTARKKKDTIGILNTAAKWQAVVSRMKALGYKLPRIVDEVEELQKQAEAKKEQEKQAKASETTQTAEKGPESPSKAKEASGQENIQGKPADASETPSNAQNGHVEEKAETQTRKTSPSDTHISNLAKTDFRVHVVSSDHTGKIVIESGTQTFGTNVIQHIAGNDRNTNYGLSKDEAVKGQHFISGLIKRFSKNKNQVFNQDDLRLVAAVNQSSAVYAIGSTFRSTKDGSLTDTGKLVYLALYNKKPVLVYDTNTGKWSILAITKKDGKQQFTKTPVTRKLSIANNALIVGEELNDTNARANRRITINELFNNTVASIKNGTSKLKADPNYTIKKEYTEPVTPQKPTQQEQRTVTVASKNYTISKPVAERFKAMDLDRLEAYRETLQEKLDNYEQKKDSLSNEQKRDWRYNQTLAEFIDNEIKYRTEDTSDARLVETKEKVAAPKTASEAAQTNSSLSKNSFRNQLAEKLGVARKTSKVPQNQTLEETVQQPQDGMENTSDKNRDEKPAESKAAQFIAEDRLINTLQEKDTNKEVLDTFNPNTQVTIGKPDCMITLDPDVYFDNHLIGSAERKNTFLHMLKTMLFSPHLLKETTNGDPITNSLAYITTRQEEKDEDGNIISTSSLLGNAPHYMFLFDVDETSEEQDRVKYNNPNIAINKGIWKPNRLGFALVDYSLREFFGTSSLDQYFGLGQTPPIDQIAILYGLEPDKLSPAQKSQLVDTLKTSGIPRTVAAEAIGRLIVENLGLREKIDTSNLDYYNKLVVGFGSFALDWGAKLGLYDLTSFDPFTWYVENVTALAVNMVAVDLKQPSTSYTFNGLSKYLNDIKISSEEAEQRKQLLLESLDTALQNVDKNGVATDCRDIPLFDYKTAQALGKFITHGQTNHALSNITPCIKINSLEQLNKIKAIKEEYHGTYDEETGLLRDNGLKQLKTPDCRTSKEPHWDKPTIYDPYNTTIRNTGGKIKASPFKVRVMQELSSIPYQVDEESLAFLDEENLWDDLAFNVGWQTEDEIEKLSYSGQLSAEGVNISIQNDFMFIRDALQQQKTLKEENQFNGIYFDFFEGRNGRIHNASTTINQQASKFARFGVLPIGAWFTYDPTNQKHIAHENHCIAQAFDMFGKTAKETNDNAEFLKSLSIEELKALRTLMCKVKKDKFKEECLAKYGREIGIENIAQCFNVINHLIKRKQNTSADGKTVNSFETSLFGEYDSTTSGYANKILNMPYEETVNATDKGQVSTFFNKVGVFVNPEANGFVPTTAHQAKKSMPTILAEDAEKQIANLDMYKTVAMNVSENIINWIDQNGNITNEDTLRRLFGESIGKDFGRNQSVDAAINDLIDIFKVMQPALPKAMEGKIDTALRTMMKNPTMVFIYSAGVNTMSKNMSVEIMENFLDTYVAAKRFAKYDPNKSSKENRENNTNEKLLERYFESRNSDVRNKALSDKDKVSYLAIMNSIDKIAEKFVPNYNKPNETFLEALEKRPYADIYIRQGNQHITLDTLFMRLIGSTYGRPAANTLTDIFEKYVKANDDFIQMTGVMFDLYNDAYTEGMRDIRISKNNIIHDQIKTKDARELEHSLESFLPYITTPDNITINGRDTAILPMIKTTKSFDRTNKAQNYTIENGQLTAGTSAYGSSRVPASPGRSGAVLGTQGIDAHLISLTALKYASKGITVIHDAVGCSPFVHEEITHDYNENLVAANLNYSLYGDMFKNFNRCINNYIQYRVKKDLEKKLATKTFASDAQKEQFIKNKEAELLEEVTGNVMARTVKDENGNPIKYPGSRRNLTVADLLARCTEENNNVEEQRNNLRNSVIQVANMDSATPDGAAIVTPQEVEDHQAFVKNVIDSIFKHNRKLYGRFSLSADLRKEVENALDNNQDIQEVIDKAKAESERMDNAVSSPTVFNSNPVGYCPIGTANIVYTRALNNSQDRVNLMSYLRDVCVANGEHDVSDKHFAYLQTLVGALTTEATQNVIFELADNGYFTAGKAEHAGNTKTVSIILGDKQRGVALDAVTGLSAASLMSPLEIYVHEMLHLANEYAFTHRNELGINKLINKLLRNREEASNYIKWEDLMPEKGTYDESLQEYYEDIAHRNYNYMFSDTDHNNLTSLNEYCSIIATCEKLRQKLENRYPQGSNNYKNLKFIDKAIKILKDIYNVVFGPKTFKEAYNNLYEMFKGNAGLKQQTLLADFDNLTQQLRTVQYKAKNRILEHPMRWIESLFSIAGKGIHWGDTHLHDLLYKIFNYSDLKYGAPVYDYVQNIPLYATNFEKLKKAAKVFRYFFTSGKQRAAAKQLFADVMNFHQQGVFMSVMRDFLSPDNDTAKLESLGLRLRSVDRASKGLESTVYQELKEGFGRELNDAENNALTNCCLYTDLQCCLDYGLDTIKKWLADNALIDKEIESLRKNFIGKYNLGQINWINSQINNLASFLVYHTGNPGMNYNATNIAKGIGYQGDIIIDLSQIPVIDKLITLTALRHIPLNERKLVNTLSVSGLEKFLTVHKQFVDESTNGMKIDLDDGTQERYSFMAMSSVLKGYTKQLTDPNLELEVTHIDPAHPNEMRDQGFKLIRQLEPNAVTNRPNVGIYTRFGLPQHTDGAIASLQGKQVLGQTLRKLAWNLSDKYPEAIPDSNKLFTVYRNEADKQYLAIHTAMAKKELTFEECAELHKKHSGYIPQPMVSKSTMPADYSITISREIKRNNLGLDERGLTVLSKMYGSITRQVNGTYANQVLLSFLRQQESNLDKNHKDKNGNTYIKLEKGSPNKYLQKMWKAVPQSFKDDIEANGDLWVREDWLQDLFGVQNYTLNNAKWIKRIPSHWLKRCIALAEMIFKTIAYYRKQSIVIRIPGVLIGNILSNIAYSVLNHKNPLKVFKTTLANARAIRDYLDTKKELNRILFKQRLGTASSDELAKTNRLKDRLANNLVAPLMEKGMYQAIVEDLNPDDLESIGTVNKWLKKNKLVQKLPNAIKWGFKQVYMAEGTPIYDFMFTATQYSDFIARATEYQLCMEKVPSEYQEAKTNGQLQLSKKTKQLETLKEFTDRREQEISTEITNAFINYDKPQSQAEQYLNDLGFLMFTKFAKRIQHVIGRQLYHKPISAILFLLSQHFLIDTEDILEQNVFNKHWSALVHDPLNNFLESVVPMPVQFLFGDQKVI